MAQAIQNDLIINFQKSRLDSFITCFLCKGYFRFAHTVAECGHTFCKYCIFTYLQTLKGNNFKCPSCGIFIENDYKKSVKKDPFKQSLIDILYPEFAKQDETILRRIRELFPDYSLQSLVDEYNFNAYQHPAYKRRKLNDPEKRTKGLLELVEERLNIDFETFICGITSEKEFETYRTIINNKIKKKESLNENFNLKLEPEVKKEYNCSVKIEPYNEIKIKKKMSNEVTYPSLKLNESDNILKISLAARSSEEKHLGLLPHNENNQSLETSSFDSNNDVVILLHPKTEDDYKVAQLKNAIKLKNSIEKPLRVEQIKKIIIKRILNLAKTQKHDLINYDLVNIDNLILTVDENIISNEGFVSDLKSQDIVKYELLFKL